MSDKPLSASSEWSVSEDSAAAECATCAYIRAECAGFGPRHNGSRNCESGSIASGGQVAHCSCDTCF